MRVAMILTLMVLTFFVVVATGPAGREALERRRALREFPSVRQLPSGTGCPICNRASCAYSMRERP